MAFSMHSHSGQFCSHAKNTLSEMVERAVDVGFTTVGLTEHMPRYRERELYPEELAEHDGDAERALAALRTRHKAFLMEARRLRDQVYSRAGMENGRGKKRGIDVLVGLEAEFIDVGYAERVAALMDRGGDGGGNGIDYVVGAVHHVHGIPIDYNVEMFNNAVAAAVSARTKTMAKTTTIATDATTTTTTTAINGHVALCEDYYDLQHEMLKALRPRVVAHFDLVRLFLPPPPLFHHPPATTTTSAFPSVWPRILRNLRRAARDGALVECSAAALRKGLAEPYPARAVAKAWIALGGRFTLADDAHAVSHVAAEYPRTLAYLASLGVEHVWTFRRRSKGVNSTWRRQTPPPPLNNDNDHDQGYYVRPNDGLEEVAVPLVEIRALFPLVEGAAILGGV